MLLTFYSIVTLWANSPALAIETRFGETAELQNDNLQRWWKKDHEARLLLRAGSLSQSKAAFEEAVSIA
ncbi:hypothetical protein KBI23_16960, partial [bacterium]|nr:hypothetical protein [bacterium]